MKRQHIVILGGGFAGVRVAQQLAAAIKLGGYRVTMIDREDHHLYTPSLYEIVGGAHPRQVCIPLAALVTAAHGTFQKATIERISLREKTLTATDGRVFTFDQLVLAPGSVTNFFEIPGLPEYAFPLKTLKDAWALRQHLDQEFRDASEETRSIAERKLYFLIAGAGPTGVELAGELAAYVQTAAKIYAIPRQQIHIELVEANSQILARFLPAVRRRVARRLRQLGIRLTVGTTIKAEHVRSIILSQGRRRSETLIWTAGVRPNPILKKIRGLVFDQRGLVIVDGHLRAYGQTNCWVLGDVASISDAGTAQAALHQADVVAENLIRLLEDRALAFYDSRPVPVIMPIGHSYAVAQFGRWVIAGWLAGWFRRIADFRYLCSILSFLQAWRVFRAHDEPCLDCHRRLCDLLWTDGKIA